MDYVEACATLKAAVVGQACEDYCYALRNEKKYRNGEGTKKKLHNDQVKIIDECESFFHNGLSFWLESDVDPDVLIEQLKKIAKDTYNHKVIRFLKNVSSAKEKTLYENEELDDYDD